MFSVNQVEQLGKNKKFNPGSLLRGASATLLASVLSIVLGLLLNILLGRWLGPDIKGRIDLINATVGLAVIVFGFSINSGITYTVARGNLNLRLLGWQLIGLAFFQGLLALVSFVILSKTRLQNAFIPSDYLNWGGVLISVFATIVILTGYWRAILSGLQHFVLGAVLDIFTRVLIIIMAVVILFFAGDDHNGAASIVVVGLVVVNFIALCLTLLIVWPLAGTNSRSSNLREVLRYSIPSYWANIIQFANYKLDVFLVAFYIGIREVALYTMAVSIAQLMWLPSSAFQAVLFPRLSALFDNDRKAVETAQVLRLILLFTILGAFGVGILAPWGMTFVFGAGYSLSTVPLLLLLPGVATFCIANIICGYFLAVGKPHLNLLISLAGFFVTLTADFALIPRWGMVGAAIASSTSYFISASLALYFFKRVSNYSLARTLFFTYADVVLVSKIVKDVLAGLPRFEKRG